MIGLERYRFQRRQLKAVIDEKEFVRIDAQKVESASRVQIQRKGPKVYLILTHRLPVFFRFFTSPVDVVVPSETCATYYTTWYPDALW